MPAIPVIFSYLATYLPMIFGFVQIAENATAAIQGKTGTQKLAAVTQAVVTAAPAIGQLIQADPAHSNHLNDYIEGSVALMKSLNASFPGQINAQASQQSASGA